MIPRKGKDKGKGKDTDKSEGKGLSVICHTARMVVEVWLHSFLTLIVDRVDGQRHSPAVLPKEMSRGTRCREGRLDPRTGLEGCGRKEVSCPNRVQTRTAQPAHPTLSGTSRPRRLSGLAEK